MSTFVFCMQCKTIYPTKLQNNKYYLNQSAETVYLMSVCIPFSVKNIVICPCFDFIPVLFRTCACTHRQTNI